MYLLLILGAIVALFPFAWMLLTSIKTYGEFALREPWPKGLTRTPYTGLPPTEEVVVDLRPVAEGEWGGAPSSDLPLMEGRILIDQVTAPVAEQLARRGIALPVEVLILVADTKPEVEGYDTFYYSIGSRVIQQETVRAYWGDGWKAPYYIEAPDMERWGPQLIVVDNDPHHFVVRKTWRPTIMLVFNYIKAWFEANFARYTWNSVRLTLITLAGVLTFSTLAAYAFARMEFPGRNFLFTVFLATLMLPEVVTLIPNFAIVIQLNRFFERVLHIENAWLNNWTVLTIPFMASTFSIFLLRQFFAQIPNDLYDAALIDGCGHLRFLLQVVLPLAKAPLMSVIVLNGIWSWNAFLWPLIVTRDDTWRPITVGLSKFTMEAAAEVHLMMAGATITIIPILILYFFTQKQFTEGIATTGLKG
jgi:ABC-type glycerol-3-phosphate transport system permease component